MCPSNAGLTRLAARDLALRDPDAGLGFSPTAGATPHIYIEYTHCKTLWVDRQSTYLRSIWPQTTRTLIIRPGGLGANWSIISPTSVTITCVLRHCTTALLSPSKLPT